MGVLTPGRSISVSGRWADWRGEGHGTIVIEDGMITGLGEGLPANLSYGASSYLILPGFVDSHVHMRYGQEQKEDVQHFSRAALRGGVVAVADMPNNPMKPKQLAPLDAESYGLKAVAIAGQKPAVDVHLYGGIVPDSQPFGASVYKLYTESVGDLKFPSMEAIDGTLRAYKGQRIALHAEHLAVMEENRGKPTHEERRPPEAEVEGIKVLGQMVRRHGVNANWCHVSTAESMRYIESGDFFEVTPHHLMIDAENRGEFAHPKWLYMNPPLRGPGDRKALIEALKGGRGMIGTDHAPHEPENKDKGPPAGPSGVPAVEVFGATVGWLMEQGMKPEVAAQVSSWNAAQWLGEPYGEIKVGSVGSLVVMEKTPWKLERPLSKCGWSPWEGFTFPWRVATTIVRGEVHHQDKSVEEQVKV